MKTSTGFVLIMLGLVMTMFGVGGVENSVTDTELLASVAVAAVGLLIMWAGTLGVRNGEYYD